jgi:hypothetical protein
MNENRANLDRPIRVVLFGGGPTRDPGVIQLINRLAEHPEVEFLGVFCESPEETFRAVFLDLWRRRGWIGLALFPAYPLGRLRGTKSTLADGVPPLEFVPRLHAPGVLSRVQALRPDLGLVYGGPILKPELFQIPVFGTLGIHHGKVPEYRGKKTTFWAMFNGEREVGVTIQRISSGLDKGDVVRQGEVTTGSKSLSEVCEELEAMGVDLFVEAILDVKRGTASYLPQEQGRGRLYKDPSLADLLKFHWRQLNRRHRFNDHA